MSKKNLTPDAGLIPASLRWETVPAQAEAVLSAIGESHDLLGQFYRSMFAAITSRSAPDARAVAALGLEVYQNKGGLTVQQANRLKNHASGTVPAEPVDLSQTIAYLGLARLHARAGGADNDQITNLLDKAGMECVLVERLAADGGRSDLLRLGSEAELTRAQAALAALGPADALTVQSAPGAEKWWFFRTSATSPATRAALRGACLAHEIVRDEVGRLIARMEI